MTELRAAKVAGIEVPDVQVDHEDGADTLVIGWGSSEGAIRAGVRRARTGGRKARAHLHHLNPLPANLGDVLRSYRRVLLPEMNSGQLARVLRSEYLVDLRSYTRVEGRPLFAAEIEHSGSRPRRWSLSPASAAPGASPTT